MSTTLAVGVFDGLHRGHQALFARALARAAGGRCVALSFDPHPDVVLAREFRSLPPLTPLPEKQERLQGLGVELHVEPFTRELAGTSPEAFVEAHILRPFAPSWLVVGEDFALGRGRAGNVERLHAIGRDKGYELEAVPLLRLDGGTVTSTRVRASLAAGDVALAARLLGRHYGFSGRVVPGDQVGRDLGFPTANLRLFEERQLPRDGVYVGRARIDRGAQDLPAAVSIGVRPTLGGGARVIEVHLVGWRGDLYGHELEIELVAWLREQLAFETTAMLIEAIRADVACVGGHLAAAGPPGWLSGSRNA